MKKAIVTGANGFIGNNLVKELLSHNVEVFALVRNNHIDNLPKNDNLKIIPFDLENIENAILPYDDYDCFYHLAWEGSAGKDRANTKLQLQNAQWSVESLILAKNIGCKKFIGVGTIMEHETIASMQTQGNKPGLGYIYGSGKLVSHAMCKSIASDIGIDLIWAEITNAYGIGELSPRMINTTIRKIISGESPKFTSGTQNYDFVYIDDVSRAFYLIGENGKPFHNYLIGSSTARPLKEFLLEMKKSIAPNLDFVFGDVPFMGTNLDIKTFDCSQTEIDTGFKAKVNFSEGTKKTKEWLKSLENN
jgi:nucleoside-diphosphate-sugar epimerase